VAAQDLLGEDIVQKDKRLGFAVCGLICLSAAMLSGCRSTASPLAEATARAGRLYDRACALLNDATYKVGDEYAPLTALKQLPDGDGGLIELAPPGQINPKADAAIKEAIDCLTKAMESAEGQPELDKLQAKVVLARLYSLRGYRHSLEAARKGDAAWAGALKVENAVVQMSGLGRRIANCDQVLSVNDESLGKLAEAAKTERSAIQAKIDDARKKVSDLEKEKADLTADNKKLSESSRKLLIESRLADDPVKGVDLFDQAKTLEDEAGRNSARIAEIEQALSLLKSRTLELEAAVAATNRQTAVTGEMAGNRGQRHTEVENQRKGFVAQLTEVQKETETLAGQVIEAAKAAAASEARAAGDYDKAIKAYEDYDRTSTGFEGDPSASAFLKPDAGILAMLGDTRMARANLHVQALLLQSRLAAVVAEASKIWAGLPTRNTAPAIVAQMADYVSDVAKTRENTRDDFRWGAKAYEKATAAQKDRNLKWAYQLQHSAAYVSLYRLSGDPDAKLKAVAALDALGEQERSPLIAPTAATLRKLLADEPMPDAQAPTRPASMPATP